MTRFSRLLTTSALALTACLASASFAHATTISIGLQTQSVNGGLISTVATDGGTGSAVFSGAYGSFNANLITALGAPQRMQGNLSTTSIQLSNVTPTAGTIYVYITEQGLTSPLGLTTFLSSFTANSITGAGTSVLESTYFSNTNAIYGGTLLASSAFTAMGTSASTNLATLTGTYSETVVYAITTAAVNSSVNDTINLTATGQTAVTPEPSSLVLLGTGLIGAATTMLRRRRLIA